MIPIYLLECHSWSDGEEVHEEDHNSYYDLNYFYLVDEPGYKLMYVWHVHVANIEHGFATEETDTKTILELASEVHVSSIPREKAVALVETEVGRLKERGKYRADSRMLSEVVERALSTFSLCERCMPPQDVCSDARDVCSDARVV
jgi:hypothetical protein